MQKELYAHTQLVEDRQKPSLHNDHPKLESGYQAPQYEYLPPSKEHKKHEDHKDYEDILPPTGHSLHTINIHSNNDHVTSKVVHSGNPILLKHEILHDLENNENSKNAYSLHEFPNFNENHLAPSALVNSNFQEKKGKISD